MAIVTVKLATPLTTHKGSISELELKVPTVRSFIQHGAPFNYVPDDNGNLYPKYDDRVMVKFIADCSGVDEIALGGMTGYDYLVVRTEVFLSIIRNTGSQENPPT